MNKTMALIAVVLSMVTAFYLVGMDVTDGAAPSGSMTITDADSNTYADSDLTSTVIYIDCASVCDDAFKGCTTITKVYLSGNVKTIGNSAFEGCTSMTYIEGTELTSIGDYAFKQSKLKTADFSSKLTSIGEYAFERCNYLTEPLLTGTGVTAIGEGVFKNSGVLVEDLRNVTSITDSAFSGSSLVGQIINKNQTVKVAGVASIVLTGFTPGTILYTSVSNNHKLLLEAPSGTTLTFTDSNGITEVMSSFQGLAAMNRGCSIPLNGEDIEITPRVTTIHFNPVLNMADVTHISGSGTYTIPAPSIGAGMLEKWVIGNGTDAVTTIKETDFQTLDREFTLNPVFATRHVSYSHSQVSGTAAASSLPTGMDFTVGDAYVALDDMEGYEFSGWEVNGVFFGAGDAITTYSDHTAISVWNSTTCSLNIMSADGNVSSTRTLSPGTIVSLSSLTVTEPESKRLLGWSLTENGTVLTSDPTISSDSSLYPIFEDRTEWTVRFMDGTEVLDTITGYDGRSIVITVNNPSAEGKTFQGWLAEETGTKFYKNDTVPLSGDIDLNAVWGNVMLRLSYHHVYLENSSVAWGTVVTVGTTNAVKEGFSLTGWSRTLNGAAEVGDGSSLQITADTDLYAVWTENGRYTVTLHYYNGRTTSTSVSPGESFTVPNGMAREQATFNGWSLTSGGDSNYVAGDTIAVNRSIDLYDVWTVRSSSVAAQTEISETPVMPQSAVSTTVSLRLMDGRTTLSNTNVQSGSDYQLSSVFVPEKEGYRLLGWSSDSTAKIAEYSINDAVAPSQNTILYTVWERMMQLTLHDGSNVESEYHPMNETVQLDELEKEGYAFKGWSTEADGEIVDDILRIDSDIELYAVWEPLGSSMVVVPDSDDGLPMFSDTPSEGVSKGTLTIGAAAIVAVVISTVLVMHIRRA